MTKLGSLSIRRLSVSLFIGTAISSAADAKPGGRGPVSHSRQVAFELTFASRDLIWLDDPASPTASVYLKPRARPIATALCVSTLVEDCVSPSRRDFHEAHIETGDRTHNVYAVASGGERDKPIEGRYSIDFARFDDNGNTQHNATSFVVESPKSPRT